MRGLLSLKPLPKFRNETFRKVWQKLFSADGAVAFAANFVDIPFSVHMAELTAE